MRLLVALLVSVAFAGCFGLPEGSADFGDSVTIRYTAFDADSGMPLVWSLDDVFTQQTAEGTRYDGNSLQAAVRTALGSVPSDLQGFFVTGPNNRLQQVDQLAFDAAVVAGGHGPHFAIVKTFELGSGESGLGFSVERGLIGMLPNATRVIESRDDPTRGFSQEVTRSRWLGEAEDMTQTIAYETFNQSLGAPSIGQTFQMTQSFMAEVTSFTDDEVHVRLVLEDSYPADVVGGSVVPSITGDMFRLELVLNPGAEFTIESTPFQPAPLDLADGTYRSIGTRGDDVAWAYSATPEALIDADVTFHVTLVSVTTGQLDVDENYGKRASPVIPGGHRVTQAADDHGHSHDDGHGHTH